MTGFGFTPDRRDLRDVSSLEPRSGSLHRAARYSSWDGTQSLPDLDADEILDALADDMMAEGDIDAALRRLMERGWQSNDPTRPDMAGLRDLLDRLARRREELLDRYKLGDVLSDVRRELDEIVAQERAGVERRLDTAAEGPEPQTDATEASSDPGVPSTETPEGTAARPEASAEASPDGSRELRRMLRDIAARRLDQLEALPPDVGGRIRGLETYDFMEPAARERFDALVEKLRRQVLDQYIGGLSLARGRPTIPGSRSFPRCRAELPTSCV